MKSLTAAWLRSGEGVCVLLLASFFLVILVGSVGMRFAPAFFPRIVGVFGLICLMLIAVQVLSATETVSQPQADEPVEDDFITAPPMRKFIALAAAPVYGTLFWIGGFYVSAALSIFGIPMLLGYRRPVALSILAVVSTALMSVLFSFALDMQMPHGLIGDWFIERYIYVD
jgi:hypothetical protein